MKTKGLLLIILIFFNYAYSQIGKEEIFKDTLKFSISLKDFVLADINNEESIFYRIEEIGNKSLTNFFRIEPIKKIQVNHKIIDLKGYLLRKENYINQRFVYTNFINKFKNNVVIFVDSGCFRKKYYKVTPMLITH
tara:strand:+ start:560 stop:967 length:408 start_codon:yes stop_codon:yes gene_type:complete